VQNSKALIAGARTARVRRFVQVSIANPSVDSPFPYYRGKAAVEQHLMDSGLSYAIVRPTVLYGEGDVLMNNIAWFMRHVPVVGIPGSGHYRIQPVFIRDHVDLMRTVGAHDKNIVIDSVGPDSYTFEELLRRIRRALDCHTALVNVPSPVALGVLRVLGVFVHDEILTHEEIRALMDGLLISHATPTCPTQFDTWLQSHAYELGHSYASELERHFAGQPSYRA
jgi:NADH dehydrogenase